MTTTAAPHAGTGNALLAVFDPLDLRGLECTPVDVRVGEVLQSPGTAEISAYFPLTAVLSLMSVMSTGATTEMALVGREGMVGLRGALAASDSVTTCLVQLGGQCLRTTTSALRRARTDGGAVRAALDRYTTARLVYIAQAGACNRLHPLGGRLARWLLSLHDRIDGDAVRLSQQSIADALGVHRPSVAAELQRLHATGAIRYGSRTIRIANRALLERLACECAAVLHRAYVDLFTPLDVTEVTPPATANEAATRANDLLLAIVSHELRTPLQAILGWCTLGRQASAPPGVLDVIDRNARAQLRLLNDLLDAAGITSNTLQINPAVLEPAATIETAIETVRPAAQAKNVTLRLTVLNELCPMWADGDRLRQVLVNVLMNAVKFTDAGGSVEAEARSDDQRFEMRISDTGHGIDPDDLPYVFEPFRKAGEGNRQGLGLGLAIARALVALHGGTITLASDGPSHGTRCVISLPCGGPPSAHLTDTIP